MKKDKLLKMFLIIIAIIVIVTIITKRSGVNGVTLSEYEASKAQENMID